MGAALIIFGGLTSNPVSKVLGIRPLAGLGLISYSLYLWHYPILALGGVPVPLGLPGEVGAVALAVGLAILTYFVIETPFRRGNRTRPFLALSSLGLITLLGLVSGSTATSGYSARAGDIPWPERPVVNSEYGQVITAENSKGEIFLFGDSHAGQLRLSLSAQATEFGLDFADGYVSSCQFLLGITRTGVTECTADFQAERLAWTASVEPSFVVLAGMLPLLIEGSRFDNMEGGVEPGSGPDYVLSGVTDPDRENQKSLVQDSMRRTIQSLLNQGHTVVLVYPIPEVGWDVPTEVAQRATLSQHRLVFGRPIPRWIEKRLLPGPNSWPLDTPVTTSYDIYLKRTQSTFDALDSINSDRIIRIYPHKIFCEEREGGRCVTHDEDNVFYLDRHHLSASGARLVTSEIMKAISSWNPSR
jgi:hypothetical protein